MKRGQGYQLMERMAEERNRINADKELYRWPDEFLQADSVFLKQAIDSIKKSGQAGAGGAAIEQKSKQYTEMMKQLEYVQSLTKAGCHPKTGKVNLRFISNPREWRKNHGISIRMLMR